MKALLIGGGGREHAMAISIVKSGVELYNISPNRNPGILRVSKRLYIGNENNSEEVISFAQKIRPDIVFVGPESPLASGVTDILIAQGFRVFAPNSKAAKLETSKTFLRSLMSDHNIRGNIESLPFSDFKSASDHIDSLEHEFVIKPDGLTGGKGVMVQGFHFKDKKEAKEILRKYFEQGINKILIEKKVEGEEFSLQAFVKGKEIAYLPVVQDYKRALENDEGHNTGGMGSISFSNNGLPFISESYVKEAKDILKEIVSVMSDNVVDYVGPIYGQFMATKEGAKVIEINARLGDPEAINVLSLLNESLFEVGLSMLTDGIIDIDFKDRVNVLRYIVPVGYGENPKPSKLKVNEIGIAQKGLKLFYASVNYKGNIIRQTRSRSIGILSEGRNLDHVISRFEGIEEYIEGNYYMRKDIGNPSIIKKKKEYMDNLMKK